MTSPIARALEALSAASDCIGIDRTALAESHFDHQLGRVDDEGQEGLDAYDEVLAKIDDAIGDLRAADAGVPPPIDMVLHCPKCGKQHIDAPEPPCNKGCCGVLIPHIHPGAWSNPPHRSHLCHGCGHIWRPADVPTNGVEAVKTKGSADSAISASPAAPAPQPLHPNHLPDLRYALDALRLASEAIEPLTEAQIKLHRIKRDTAERIDAAIVGMRYIIKRTEEAAESAATPAPAPAMEGQQAAERCLDCGDPVPKRVCYCQAGCAHVGSPAVAPSAQPVTREFTNELGNSIRITIEGPTSISENVLTPVEFAELRAAIGAAPSAQEPDPNAAQLVKEQSPINKAFWDGVRWAQQPQAAGVSEPEAAKLARRADRLVQVLTAGRAVPTESVIEALREMRDAIGYGICSYYCPACFAAVRSLSTTSAPAQADARLWAVNVHGPDDLYAATSKTAALERANEMNAYFGRLNEASTTPAFDPIMRAVVIEWPHSAESHAADLASQAAQQPGGAA